MHDRSERLASVHALRGIAALLVCFFHWLSNQNLSIFGYIRDAAVFGQYGVTCFFVVSGFVLPLALDKASYSVRDLPRFLLKRLIRVEPPYLVSVFLTLTLYFLSSLTPGNRGTPVTVDIIGAALHVGYLVPFFGKEWINGVYWTLCVEFQFYILIGLIFQLLVRFPVTTLALIGATSFAQAGSLFPTQQLPLGQREYLYIHLPVFLIGTCGFLWRSGRLSGRSAAISVVGLSVPLALFQPWPVVGFAAGSLAFILWAKPKMRFLLFVGTVSYSLYLTHQLVGLKTINIISRFTQSWPGVVSLSMVAGLGIAWLMWRYVEVPSQRAAGRVHLGSTETIRNFGWSDIAWATECRSRSTELSRVKHY